MSRSRHSWDDERRAFGRAIEALSLPVDDFLVSEHSDPAAASGSGWIMVLRRSSGVSRVYRGVGWVGRFESDLRLGLFDRESR